MAFTEQALRQVDRGTSGYGTFDDLVSFYLTLPPPPVQIINQPPIITPPPSAPDPYAPLLAFIQAGPQGHLVTRAHLVQLTPSALALAQLYLTGNYTYQQLLNSTAASALLYAAQAVFQPLLTQQGLWTQQFLNSWINYLQQPQLINIVTTLYSNIVSPPPPGQPTITPVPPLIIAVNPLQIIQQATSLWRTQDWIEIAERFPGLIHPLIQHAGFSKLMIILYGSRRHYYGPSAQTMRNDDGNLDVHNINREGYYRNEYASGAGRFFQGKDDISLVYFPVEIEDGKVETLDVVASDRFALLKRMSGGDVELLNRAYTHNTSMLSIDAAFNNRHIRVVAGSTPYSAMGGLMAEITYETELLSGRIGGGGLVDTTYSENVDTFLGFLDMEHTLRSPYFAPARSKDNERVGWLWASLTLSASGMADRALSEQTDKRVFTNRWGFQGDVRLIPEVHAQVDGDYFSVYGYGGVTAAVVPYGKVDLYRPDKSLMLARVRTHFGVKLRVLVSKAVNSDREFDHTMYADAAFVGEVSELVYRWRFTTDLTFDQAKLGFITEIENYKFDGLDDYRVGARASFYGAYIQVMKSLEFDDSQLQIGVKFEWS